MKRAGAALVRTITSFNNYLLSFYAAVFVDQGIEKMKDIMNRPDNEVISLQPRTQVTNSVRQTWVP